MLLPNRPHPAMRFANTPEIYSLNQVRSGLGDLSFNGTGLFGTGLFSSGFDLTQWGVGEIAIAGLGVWGLFAAFGSGARARRSELRKAYQDYERKRDDIYRRYPVSGLRRGGGSAPKRLKAA